MGGIIKPIVASSCIRLVPSVARDKVWVLCVVAFRLVSSRRLHMHSQSRYLQPRRIVCTRALGALHMHAQGSDPYASSSLTWIEENCFLPRTDPSRREVSMAVARPDWWMSWRTMRAAALRIVEEGVDGAVLDPRVERGLVETNVVDGARELGRIEQAICAKALWRSAKKRSGSIMGPRCWRCERGDVKRVRGEEMDGLEAEAEGGHGGLAYELEETRQGQEIVIAGSAADMLSR